MNPLMMHSRMIEFRSIIFLIRGNIKYKNSATDKYHATPLSETLILLSGTQVWSKVTFNTISPPNLIIAPGRQPLQIIAAAARTAEPIIVMICSGYNFLILPQEKDKHFLGDIISSVFS